MTTRETSRGRFAGRAALVTGAASGIGRATAVLLAREGAGVLVTDRDAAGAARVAAEVTAAGGMAQAHELDVTSEAAWQAALRLADQAWGRLDVLVNCAGVAAARPVTETTLAEWRRVLAVNLDGVFLGT